MTVRPARFPASNGADGEKALAKQKAIDWRAKVADDAGGDPEGEGNPKDSDKGESEATDVSE